MSRSTSRPGKTGPTSDQYNVEWGETHQDTPPVVTYRFIRTGVLDASGRKLLRLRQRPIGFRADIDQPIYAVEEPDDE